MAEGKIYIKKDVLHTLLVKIITDRLKCFEHLDNIERVELITKLNAFETNDAQDTSLASLIMTKPVQRRRPKQSMGKPV